MNRRQYHRRLCAVSVYNGQVRPILCVCSFSVRHSDDNDRPRAVPFSEFDLAINGVLDSNPLCRHWLVQDSEMIFDMRERKDSQVGKPPVGRKLSGPATALISISYQQGAGLIDRLVGSIARAKG